MFYYLTNADNDPILRLYVPFHYRSGVIKQYHDDNGHLGIDKTFDAIRQKYYWPNLYKELYDYVSKCVTCATRNLKQLKPSVQITDNGTENENRTVKETLDALNISHVKTSYYHPQSNAKVERFHRTLHDVIAKKLEDNLSTWDVFLNQTLAAIRFNVNESAGYTPFYLLYTRDVVLPIDNILKPRRRYLGEDPHPIAL